MPTILRLGPYRFYFYSNEGTEPPHVHVDRDALTAKFWLEPVSLAHTRGFSDREILKIRDIVVQNRNQFLKEWHEHFTHRRR